MKRNHYFSSPSPLPLEFILDHISSSTRIIWIYHYTSFHFNWFGIAFCNNDMKWSEIQLKIDFLLFCYFEKVIVANLYTLFYVNHISNRGMYFAITPWHETRYKLECLCVFVSLLTPDQRFWERFPTPASWELYDSVWKHLERKIRVANTRFQVIWHSDSIG